MLTCLDLTYTRLSRSSELRFSPSLPSLTKSCTSMTHRKPFLGLLPRRSSRLLVEMRTSTLLNISRRTATRVLGIAPLRPEPRAHTSRITRDSINLKTWHHTTISNSPSSSRLPNNHSNKDAVLHDTTISSSSRDRMASLLRILALLREVSRHIFASNHKRCRRREKGRGGSERGEVEEGRAIAHAFSDFTVVMGLP